MAASPKFKVFDNAGNYQASFKDIYEVARYLSICEEGWNARISHSKKGTIYTKGPDGDPWFSFDEAVGVMLTRIPESSHDYYLSLR